MNAMHTIRDEVAPTDRTAVVKRGEGETLAVLGEYVRFLCEAERTERRFSLMEVTLPKDAGPPAHHHP